MSTLYWEWFEGIGIHALYDANLLTGFHIEPQEPDHEGCGLGNLGGKFKLILLDGETSMSYETLQEAQAAAEQLYQLDPIGLFPSPPWTEP